MKKFVALLNFGVASLAFAAVDLVNMPVNTWVQVPNTHLNSVAPSGWSGSVIDAWNGAALDTKLNRLIVWGGGHNDYYGNEIYAYEIDNEKWVRLTNPTSNYATCSDNNSDGTPVSRHTYNGLAYIAHADKFFGIGGAPGCAAGGCGANKTWTFNFATSKWQNMNPTGTLPGTCCGDVCAYDPASGKVYFGDSGAWACGSSKYGLYSYSFDTNAWVKITSDMFIGGMAVDTKRHTLFNVGQTNCCSGIYTTAFDLNSATPTRQTWVTTGGDAFIKGNATAVEYDPAADKYVGWSGGPVYALDPVTKAWSSNNPAGGPPSNVYGVTNGVYGRWRYVPKVNAFIAVVGTGLNVYFYKLTAGMGAGTKEEGRIRDNGIGRITVSPNPFYSATTIHFAGETSGKVRVFDLSARCVAVLEVKEGCVRFNGCDVGGRALAPGIYTARYGMGSRMRSVRLFFAS